jgi:hypothetical protein
MLEVLLLGLLRFIRCGEARKTVGLMNAARHSME